MATALSFPEASNPTTLITAIFASGQFLGLFIDAEWFLHLTISENASGVYVYYLKE